MLGDDHVLTCASARPEAVTATGVNDVVSPLTASRAANRSLPTARRHR